MSEDIINLFFFSWSIGLILLFICFACRKKKNTNIKNVYDDIVKISGNKFEIIQELFVDCAKFAQNKSFANNTEQAVYTIELALHIFSLWLANDINIQHNSIFIEKSEFEQKIEIKYYFLAIKHFLNILIKESLHKKEIDINDVENIIKARVLQIYKDDDIQSRNQCFINICNADCKIESDIPIVVGNFDNLPLAPGNPLLLSFLLEAYKFGLVDKYLKLL